MFILRFLFLLIRIITLNFFLLGWIFRPKWKKARRAVRGRDWHFYYILRIRTGMEFTRRRKKEVAAYLRQSVPWYSPKDIKLCIDLLSAGGRVHMWLDEESAERVSPFDGGYLVIDPSRSFDCCGGEWRQGDCGCYPERAALIKLPVSPQPSRSVDEAITAGGK